MAQYFKKKKTVDKSIGSLELHYTTLPNTKMLLLSLLITIYMSIALADKSDVLKDLCSIMLENNPAGSNLTISVNKKGEIIILVIHLLMLPPHLISRS